MLTLVFIILFFTVIELPALLVLGFWFIEQAVFAAADLTNPTGSGGGVAYFAHIGGFAFGADHDQAAGHPAPVGPAALSGVLTALRLAVFTVALLFIVALGVLTGRDIRVHGATPVDVLAIIVLVLFTTGIVGALLHPPRR